MLHLSLRSYGIKTKRNGPLRCFDVEVARKEALLRALTYNIKIYLSLFLYTSLLKPFFKHFKEFLDKPWGT